MQLNAVVLPAPLGPISPTISYSSALKVTASRACRPPKRIPRLETSRTANHPTSLRSAVFLHQMQVESVAPDPVLDRGDLLTDAAWMLDQRQHQQRRADDRDEDRVRLGDVPRQERV